MIRILKNYFGILPIENLAKAVRTFLIGCAVALTVVYFWPAIQGLLGPYVTPGVQLTATIASLTCFIIPMGLANLGVIPFHSFFRIFVYILGMIMFLIALVPQRNTGSIFLESFLITVSSPSLFAKDLIKVEIDWKKFWWAVRRIILCIEIGVLAAQHVTQHTSTSWAWRGFALLGGFLVAASIFLLEQGAFASKKYFSKMNFLASATLAISYLGEFNFVGLSLNVTMAALLWYCVYVLKQK